MTSVDFERQFTVKLSPLKTGRLSTVPGERLDDCLLSDTGLQLQDPGGGGREPGVQHLQHGALEHHRQVEVSPWRAALQEVHPEV